MTNPVMRETHVDNNLLFKAEEIINNFPDVTGNIRHDLERYRENDKVLKELLNKRNEPYDLEGIDLNKYVVGETFLIIKQDPRVEKALEKLLQLQGEYLDQILRK